MTSIRLLEPWRSRLLWLSLGLNLFAAAHFATPVFWHRHPPGPPSFDILIDRMARDLPPADATVFRDAMDRERPWFDLGRKRLDEARQDVAAAVGHQPFDPGALRTALLAMQDRLREGGTRFDESLIQSIGQLTPEGRASLAAGLQRGPR